MNVKKRLKCLGIALAGFLFWLLALLYGDAWNTCRIVRRVQELSCQQDIEKIRPFFADRMQEGQQWHNTTSEFLYRRIAPRPSNPAEIDRTVLVPMIDPYDPLSRYVVVIHKDFSLGRFQLRFRWRWFQWKIDALQGWG